MFNTKQQEVPALEFGTEVTFTRQAKVITGIVQLVRVNTVLVEISKEDQQVLFLENALTVVNHKNYTVVGA